MSVYLRVGNSRSGETRTVHRRVVERHLGRKLTSKEIVHHANGNPRDNRLKNLRVMSQAEHVRLHTLGITRSEEVKLKGRGENHNGALLTNQKVRDIRVRLSQGFSPLQVAKEFGVARATIYDVRSGKRWGYVK